MKKDFHAALRIMALLAGAASVAAWADDGIPPSVHLETFRSHSRLVFRIDEGVPAQWKSDGKSFELLLKGIGFADLGTPLGQEEQWQAQFAQLKDPRLGALKFKEVGGGLLVSGSWKFPQGADAPATPAMETFDYRERDRSEYVVDFWLKKGPTVAEVQARRKRVHKDAESAQVAEQARRRAARRIASEKARAEAAEKSQYCRQPLAEDNDIFVQFAPVHEKVEFGHYFAATTADNRYSYYEPKTKARDAQYVRLALELYRQGKPALVLKTLDFFEKEQPDSTFRHEMRFLRGNALIKLGLHDEAERAFSLLMTDATETPEALHSAMYLAGRQLEKEQHLAALETFLWLESRHPEHRYNWVFHLGAAESLYALKQTDRAAKEYQWVTENAPDPALRAEAAMRLGDLFMERFQYDQGLAAYFTGIHHFGKQAEGFAPIWINRAEALYGLGQYDRAREAFEDFLKRFPAHPGGWRATFRLGEIAARVAATAAPGSATAPASAPASASSDAAAATAVGAAGSSEARHWYYETINRFPFSPGATLARLRLLPCGDHGGFTMQAAQNFFETEAAKFDGGGEVVMTRYPDLRGLSRVRMLSAYGRDEEAIGAAIDELRRDVHSESRRILGTILGGMFRHRILDLAAQGKKYEALAFYRGRIHYLPKEEVEAEPDYLLKLSQAASDLGLGKVGEELAARYAKAQQGRAVASDSEAAGDLEPQLALSERHFSEAKALWTASDGKPAAEDAARIRELLAQVREESRFSFGREIILGLMEERAGHASEALGHAAKAQLLKPEGASPAGALRVDAWVAGLHAKAGDARIALDLYRAIEKQLPVAQGAAAPDSGEPGALGVPSPPLRDVALISEGAALEKMGRWGEAAATYARAVGDGVGGSEARYQYARALLKAGGHDNRAKALATLEKLAGPDEARGPAAGGAPAAAAKEDFWKKLAQETLADEKSKQGIENR